jgi:hypothetical protein
MLISTRQKGPARSWKREISKQRGISVQEVIRAVIVPDRLRDYGYIK